MSAMHDVMRQGPPAAATRRQACRSLPADGAAATLHGWVHSVDKAAGQLVLRSGEEMVTVLCPETLADQLHRLRPEWVVRLDGAWAGSGPSGVFQCHGLEILNRPEALPFTVDGRAAAPAAIRSRYRYLELRDPEVQRRFRLRHKLMHGIADHLDRNGFVSVETPILAAEAGSGAKEFRVSSARNPQLGYVLPQSAQAYGHLLVIGGIEKYFQWSRCFRDEDLRANRQPEFTQLHIEMAFVDQAALMAAVEDVLHAGLTSIGLGAPGPMERLTYGEATARFGTDKPDLRLAPQLRLLPCRVGDEHSRLARGLFLLDPPEGEAFGEGDIPALRDAAAPLGMTCLGFVDPQAVRRLKPQLAMADVETIFAPGARPGAAGTLLWLGDARSADALHRAVYGWLAKTRQPAAERRCFAWVCDFPLFAPDPDQKGRLAAFGHPFTAPHEPQALAAARTNKDLLALTGQSFDLVMNGEEMGSGSILIHDYELQRSVLQRLGLPKAEIRARFGYLLEAMRTGAPPMGGFGLGCDRLVASLLGLEKIRDVIAFPKTKQGLCPVTQAS